jgi:transcriptional regulator with XRE-family HTH domain
LNYPQFGKMETMPIAAFKIRLAKRIRQLRKEANLSQAELAIRIGFKDKQIVNHYEINGANPTAYNLVLIAKALDVGIDELLDFSKLKE